MISGEVTKKQKLTGSVSPSRSMAGAINAKGGMAGSLVPRGNDGYSPSVTITDIEGGHRVTITDITGTNHFDVMDGQDGQNGLPGKDGQPGADGYTPVKGVDYFDGEDGKDGVDGKDGYTPVKGVDYFDGSPGKDGVDGKNGIDGKNGSDGYTPKKGVDYFDGKDGKDGSPGKNGADGVSATHSWSGTTLTITSASGTSSADLKGDKGDVGAAGTSVTVKSVSESSADSGSNIVTFSDGKTITIKNGSKGSKGDTGSPGSPGADGSPGKDGQPGSPGADGERGTGILKVTTAPSGYTTAIGSYTPKYRIALSTVKSQSKVSKVLVGDVIQYSYYQYHVDYLDSSYAYISATRISIRGATGATGAAGADGQPGANGKDYVLTDADKAEIASMAGGVTVPDYWLSELETKADAIQTAMEKAGRNKSAFLWYTDAHWANGNSKVSPKLLNYLYMNTPMNKVNFGGDIIGDTLLATRDEMKYLYEWRKAIKDLPNHHSVFGNHDMFDLSSVDYEDDNYRYAFLLAPEESADMVMGNGNYYYIDNPCEKTRYLYLAYIASDHTAMLAQGQFICDAIKAVPEGWHIVAIAHRWWQYSSSSTPTTGAVSAFEKDILSVFDAYNARETRSGSNYFYAQDFTDAKGKVEFCIGGHIHVDYDFESDGGIPVIITTADTNQNRVPSSEVDSGTIGTTTEAAVFGIIADYNDADNIKITVVGVGRGTSRVVRKSTVKPESISDISYSGDTTIGATIDKAKFTFTVNYSNGATDTVTGATSVSPVTIGVVGNNTVTITYTEGATTLSGTATIVGTPVPVVNLLNLDRTYVAGTAGESIGKSYLDESKAFTNVVQGTNAFNASACTVSDATDNGVTVKESGIGGMSVVYPVRVPNIGTKAHSLSFDYTGNGSTRVWYKYATAAGVIDQNVSVVNTSGSGHIDATIPAYSGFAWLLIFVGANTGKTTTLSNVTLTEVS